MLYLLNQPWRCLCRGSLQITRTTPLRRIILQFRQIFLTDVNTFMSAFPYYLARNVIRALLKSYGVKSTVTLSPGKIRM